MQGTLRIGKPKQSPNGYWVIRGKFNGNPITFDTSLSPLGPWCVAPNGSSARACMDGGSPVAEVPTMLAIDFWERVREIERDHIRLAVLAAERAGVGEDARMKMRASLHRNAGKAQPWQLFQVTGVRRERVRGKTVKHLKTRKIACGQSLIRALAAYRKLIESNRHTTIRRAV